MMGSLQMYFMCTLCIIIYVNMMWLKRITFTPNCIKIMLLHISEYPRIILYQYAIVFKDESIAR